ncbi:hypothetical protein AN459_16785 [Pseudomonas aeruginosa]|nr:hypothetical protein AN459_16785 [Pseudomonas aeruginosa]KSR07553.1 hypothetical protein APB43_30815 [Pseudomonas aeruginosa]RMK44717.1 hypothetical protein IPC92_18840 [Pseudomonas aeruginosa]
MCFIGKLGGRGRGILPNQKVFFRVSLTAAGMQMAHDRGLHGARQARFGLSFSLAFGVGKELYDSRSAGSGWSWKDLAWDLAGAAAGYGLYQAAE